jgi:hypothetical protein
MNLKDRMTAIEASLDDLQSGMEASSRAADALKFDTTKSGEERSRSVLRHVKDLESSARHQRAAMQELRNSVARLQEELERSSRGVRPPSVKLDQDQ